jgi:hypothetical protein
VTGRRALPMAQQPAQMAVGWRCREPADRGELRSQRAAVTAFAAFRERQYEPYLQYAALRIGRYGAAETAVAGAFTELAVCWIAVLGSAGPAAIAWRILHDHIEHVLGGSLDAAPLDQGVRALQQDVRLLHRQMQLSLERIAEVLGIPPADVLGLLPAAACSKE